MPELMILFGEYHVLADNYNDAIKCAVALSDKYKEVKIINKAKVVLWEKK